MKKVWLGMLLLAVPLTAYFGFTRDQNLFSDKPESDHSKYGGTLVVGITGDIDSLNPLFTESASGQEITHLLLLGLADLNENSEFVPELATSWESSNDYRKLTYHLRKDAVWSDGVPITAEDVKFTYDLLMDSTVASPRQYVAEYIDRVVVEDPHTVSFEFTEAYPDQMFDTAGEILPKHILEGADRKALRSHDFGRQPVSSGPFVLNKWVSQQYIELAANDRYFGGRPRLDRVIFKIVPDNTSLLLQLQTGEVDMMIGVPPAEVERLRQNNPNIEIYPVSGRVYYYIGYNEASPLFASAAIRRALTLAIDRRQIIQALLYGYGEPCLGPIPPMIDWAYNDQIAELPYDPQRARSILRQHGWRDSDGDGLLDKNGRPFSFTLKTNSGNQLKSDVGVIIQDHLKRVGIKVDLQVVEWTTLLEETRLRKFDAYIGGWSTSFNVDPTPIFHSSAVDLFNNIGYANPRVDQLIERGRSEMDRTKAAPIWKELQHEIYNDQPYTFLFWIDRIVAADKRFKNVTPIPLSALYNLENWYVDSSAD